MGRIRVQRWASALLIAAIVVPAYTGLTASAAAAAATCQHVPSDFNGDGYADLATGTPNRYVGDINLAGSIQIDYGSATGFDHSKSHYYDQNSPGMPGEATALAQFGQKLVSGYFNDDCYADLAVSQSLLDPESPGGHVIVLYGSASGLNTTGAGYMAAPDDQGGFGLSLASGDFNHDGLDDLAIGAPQATDAAKIRAGVVDIVDGTAHGLTGALTPITQSTDGIAGTSEKYDEFAWALAAGDFNHDGYDDLAIGTPGETDGPSATGPAVIGAGAIRVVYGSAGGVTGAGSATITQATPGVPGTNEAGDQFGEVLAAGDVNGDGYADLVVGVPDESVGKLEEAGGLAYLPGGAAGVTGAGSIRYSTASAGVPGTPRRLYTAGAAIAVGDFNDDGHADIAMGVPFDSPSTSEFIGGSVVIFDGTATGPTAVGATALSEGMPGFPIKPAIGADFGAALRAADVRGTGRPDLVVAAIGVSCADGPDCGTVVEVPSGAGGLAGTGVNVVAEAADGPGGMNEAGFGHTFG